MPTITLSDTVFNKLKTISEPFVDTPETRIARLIDDEVERRGALNSKGSSQCPKSDCLHLNIDSPESLTFTRLLSVTVDGREVPRPNWKKVRDELHITGLKALGSFDALKRASGAQLREGRYEQDGFTYFSEADLSIQGVDANLSWNHILQLARALDWSIKITFEWRNKDGATHPGQRGVLEWNPAAVDLASRKISPDQAESLRFRLKTFETDWQRPEMDAYDEL